MIAFIVSIVFAVVLFGAARFLGEKMKAQQAAGARFQNPLFPALRVVLLVTSVALALFTVLNTSFVWVPGQQFATLTRTIGKPLPPGKIIATDPSEAGPQARILTQGLKFSLFIRLLHDVKFHPVFTVQPNTCAIISAVDGEPVLDGGSIAEPWTSENYMKFANDAEFFLKNHGRRGQQATVLVPSSYTLHPILWPNPKVVPVTRVEQGTGGVIKSSVHAAVDFGAFKRPKPESPIPTLLNGRVQSGKIPVGAANVSVVSTGSVGVWEEALPNGLYFINTEIYKVTMVPVSAMVFEYKGGYRRRSIDILVDDDTGKITQKEASVEVPADKAAADTAIFIKPEGWDVAQEARVQVQISLENAPLVVAALALNEANAAQVIEDRVVTPVIRSVVRDVGGGSQLSIRSEVVLTDASGAPQLDEQGVPKTRFVTELRPLKVLDLLNNRNQIEEEIEKRARPEILKEFVSLIDVRLSETAIPPELLNARKREQLAQQMTKAWNQEQLAQVTRQQTENARAVAEQQGTLVKAQIAKQAAQLEADSNVLRANGQEQALLAIARGQEAQKKVMSESAVVELRRFELQLTAIQEILGKDPTLLKVALENAGKLVPNVVVNNSGSGSSSGFEGPLAVLGHFLGMGASSPAISSSKTTQPVPSVAQPK